MRFFATSMIVVLTTLGLSSCASIGLRNHDLDYAKNTQQISPTILPANVPLVKKDTYYVVPAAPVHHGAIQTDSTVPPTLMKQAA